MHERCVDILRDTACMKILTSFEGGTDGSLLGFFEGDLLGAVVGAVEGETDGSIVPPGTGTGSGRFGSEGV